MVAWLCTNILVCPITYGDHKKPKHDVKDVLYQCAALTGGRLQLNLDDFNRCGGEALHTAANGAGDGDLRVGGGVMRSAEHVEHFAVDAEEDTVAHTVRHQRESHATVQ